MPIGFTGTRQALTVEQNRALYSVLFSPLPTGKGFGEAHHGDCVGGDKIFHDFLRFIYRDGLRIVVHPPVDSRFRANCKGDVILEPTDYMARNRAIVDASDLLIAAPKGPEHLRSGTWATVRYARKTKTPILLVHPDGKTELDDA